MGFSHHKNLSMETYKRKMKPFYGKDQKQENINFETFGCISFVANSVILV
jgi:hypothetical protein